MDNVGINCGHVINKKIEKLVHSGRREIKCDPDGAPSVTDMSWPWNNPTEKQAKEAYEYYKKKYNTAATQKWNSEREEQSYTSQRNAASNKLSPLTARKISLEKRLRGVEEIIKILEGTNGWLSADVPDAIERAKRSAGRADESFRNSIKQSDTATADLEGAFRIKTVREDARTDAALAALKAEKVKLEQIIEECNAEIRKLSNQIAELKRKIDACNTKQASLRRDMSSYLYDMEHYRKKISP